MIYKVKQKLHLLWCNPIWGTLHVIRSVFLIYSLKSDIHLNPSAGHRTKNIKYTITICYIELIVITWIIDLLRFKIFPLVYVRTSFCSCRLSVYICKSLIRGLCQRSSSLLIYWFMLCVFTTHHNIILDSEEWPF